MCNTRNQLRQRRWLTCEKLLDKQQEHLPFSHDFNIFRTNTTDDTSF